MSNKIIPHLWFEKDAKKIADFYLSVFKNARIINANELHNTPGGTVEIVEMEIEGQNLLLLSAGPTFKLNESFSLVINCDNQEEIDYYWEKLSAVPEAEQCGWLKDKYGLSWQITPTVLSKMLKDQDPEKVRRVTEAFLKMKKFNIAELEQAFRK